MADYLLRPETSLKIQSSEPQSQSRHWFAWGDVRLPGASSGTIRLNTTGTENELNP